MADEFDLQPTNKVVLRRRPGGNYLDGEAGKVLVGQINTMVDAIVELQFYVFVLRQNCLLPEEQIQAEVKKFLDTYKRL